ncbi:hypothetical protein MLD52_15285 [Puniceicoccaceae bacterium K14]|nr:hypothetical protein [Puniceicoccaceae bacterium K14]
MEDIFEIIGKEDVSLIDLIGCIDLVKERGDVFVLKADGEREIKGYTVFISRVGIEGDMIRSDSDDLKAAILSVLKCYVSAESPE